MFLTAIVLLSAISVVVGSNSPPPPSISSARVIGGSIVDITNYPFIVSLRHKDRHFCGGSIITPNTILTASHCFDGFNDIDVASAAFSIRVGSTLQSLGERYQVTVVIRHPRYNASNFQNDVAIMKLHKQLVYGPTVKSIVLCTARPAPGSAAIVIGWGMYGAHTKLSVQLRAVMVPYVASALCKAMYPTLTGQMLCAGERDGVRSSCPGDSGGPLVDVRSGGLLGIVSHGPGCGRSRPAVYASVPDLLPWIMSVS